MTPVGRERVSPPSMGAWIKLLLAIMAIGVAWVLVLFRLGVYDVTYMAGTGVLSNTFNGWVAHPEAKRFLLAQYLPDDFGRGFFYSTYTYPFLLSMYAIVEASHLIFTAPYDVAHNVLAYVHVIALSLLLVFVTRDQLLALFDRWSPLHWLLAFLSIGVVVTEPLTWVAMLLISRDHFHVMAAASFCYLSTYVFRDEIPRTPLLAVGVFLALWSPIYIPAWMLTVLFFTGALVLDRRLVLTVLGVSALAALNVALPIWIGRWAGYTSVSSPFSVRSGLDGDTQYMSSVYQAVFTPIVPRDWPIGFYLVITAALAVYFHFVFRRTTARRPLQQALFLTIPYITIAIMFPQFTSIHPYYTDMLMFVPAAFLIAFWFLQKEWWQTLNGRGYIAWVLVVSLVLMTNLLTVAQDFNLQGEFVKQRSSLAPPR